MYPSATEAVKPTVNGRPTTASEPGPGEVTVSTGAGGRSSLMIVAVAVVTRPSA